MLVLVFLCILIFSLWDRYYTYDSYEVLSEVTLENIGMVGCVDFGENILCYSRDGVTCIDTSGQKLWIESYEMKNPIISVNGDYAAIADSQGNSLYIFGTDGKVGQATTTLSILRVTISSTGVVAVTQEDSDAGYVYFFSKDGSALDISIKALLTGDGFPIDLSLSPDGTRLIVGYQYINGSTISGKAIFYDFSEIGKNYPNRVLGGENEAFDDSLIARVWYLTDDYSFVAADTGLYFFSSKNATAPQLSKSYTENIRVSCIFTSREYVGAITQSTADETYSLSVYSASGNEVFTKTLDETYTNGKIYGQYVFLYGSSSGSNTCAIYNMTGTAKYSGSVDFSVSSIRRGFWADEFVLIGSSNIKKIKLK